MAEKSPREIFKDYKEGKCAKSAAIEKLSSIFQDSRDNDEIKIQVVELLVKHFLVDAEGALKWIITNEHSPNCLYELYQSLDVEGDNTEELRQFMELTIGRDFLKKYDLIPKEAMALELIGRGLVWHHPDRHSNPKDWKRTPCQWTDVYSHKVENGIVIQIWISYELNMFESKYFKLLSRLSKLYLYDCRLTDYSFLTHLKCLTVSGGDVPQISEIDELIGLEKLVNLEELDLTYNEISEIKNLDNLAKLKKLDLSKNSIEEIKGLHSLSQLEDLNLHFNKISEIKGLENLVNLKKLNLSENYNVVFTKLNLKDTPELHELEKMKEFLNKAKDIDDRTKSAILNMKKTMERDKKIRAEIVKNTFYISEIKGLENLVNLEELYLSESGITQIIGIDQLKNLRILDLSKNPISDLQGIENLKGLKELYVYDTQISEEKLKDLRKRNQFLKIKN